MESPTSRTSFFKRHRRSLVVVTSVLSALVLLVVAANAYVLIKGNATIVSSAEEASPSDAAIVLGAKVNPDGSMSKMLADRVAQGNNLWQAGKVERIIVSGAPDQNGLNQPQTMKETLLADGVPAQAIEKDNGGLNTDLSMKRARNDFDVKDALIVTQGFHMKRALFLADAAGIDAEGVSSDLHGYGYQGIKSSIREIASRVKAVKDVIFDG
ncbi:MAG: ElyC/SanA/YdcF family protein [Solirubrobacterales bacterium]